MKKGGCVRRIPPPFVSGVLTAPHAGTEGMSYAPEAMLSKLNMVCNYVKFSARSYG